MNFWKNKSVLVTGNTGFKGTWLTFSLTRLGAKVHGYSLKIDTQPNLFDISHAREYLASHTQADVRDLTRFKQALHDSKADVVFHLAAQPLVRKSYANPIETFGSNVMGTVTVLEALRFNDDVKAALMITTDKVYRNKEWLWPYRESEELGGRDPYSASKSCAEIAIESYQSSYFNDISKSLCKVASARAGNIIGGGDWAPDRLIPDMMRALASDQPLHVRNPHSVRPWQHVLEPVFGYLLLAEKLVSNREIANSAWNFGPRADDCVPVDYICNVARKFFTDKLRIEYDQKPDQPHESGILKLDSTKAQMLLGWKTRYTIELALRNTFTWYKNYMLDQDPRELVLSDIDSYIGSGIKNENASNT